ncbi:Ig-like V-type domain-containing protein FAM187A [Mytilus trossulus]|uniref:Ig-like V-type domain-containing protein FAM187A n=1 Tax=Mytilus trossulus TaxID=6551 RepID=UPI003006DFA2
MSSKDLSARKWMCVKVSVLIWCFSVAVIIFIVQYLRIIPTEIIEVDEEEDDLIKRTLNLHNVNEKKREKRATDYKAYKEMGWRFTPEEAKLVFSAYYKCIEERNAAYSEKIHVKAILALEGQTVKMTCHSCFRPDQDPSSYHIEWQQLRAEQGELDYVENSKRVNITPDKMLVILNVDVVDRGQYFCVQSNIQEYIEIYQLDVIEREKRITLPESDIKKLLPQHKLPDNNLKLFTLWSEWSDCNQCNRLGKRRKVGICMVNKIEIDEPIEPMDIPMIILYPDGIPCRSTILPPGVKRLQEIRDRKSETILGDCFLKCPTTPAFLTITDSNGKIVETIDSGFYSLKSKPTLPPMVKRKVTYADTGKSVVLLCPNSSKKNSLIRWQNGSIPFNPLTIKGQTRGRVQIDTINRLHIKGLRKSDTAVYSCWIQAKLVGTVKLIITTGIDPKVHQIITTTGIVLTIICLSLICICTLGNKARKKNATK